MDKKKLLLAHLIIPLVYGFLDAGIIKPKIITWYQYLDKPFFSPPTWVFVSVWIILYLMMGFAAFLIDTGKSKNREKVLRTYWIQLIANFLWPAIFFGMRNPSLAFIEIILLWLLINKTIWQFFRISKTAGYLLVPYIVWVTFAATLNMAIIILN